MHILPLSAEAIEKRLTALPDHVVDQEYSANSQHPQSGVAVAQAIASLYTHYVGTEIDKNNCTGVDYLEPAFKVNDIYINETEKCMYQCISSESLNDGSGAFHSVWRVVSPVIDQEYSPESEDAQSGRAVAAAVEAVEAKIREVESKVGNDTITNQVSSAIEDLNLPSMEQGSGEDSIILGEGNATGKYAIAGGTTDTSVVEDITGVSVDTLASMESTVVEALGDRGPRLASNLKNDPTPKATGVGSIAFGTGAESITAMSTTIGAGAEAGSKGFYIHSLTIPSDGGNIIVQLSRVQKPYHKYNYTYSILGSQKSGSHPVNENTTWDNDTDGPLLASWSVGDEVNIILRKPFCLCEKIVNIRTITDGETEKFTGIIELTNSGTITAEDWTKVTEFDLGEIEISLDIVNTVKELVKDAAKMSNLVPYQFSVAVPSKPDVGCAELHFAATATGLGNIAAGTLSQAHGAMNLAAGPFGFVVGQQNKVGYGAFASGQDNRALGYNSHAEGVDNDTVGSASHAEGSHTTALGNCSHAEGSSVINFHEADIENYSEQGVYDNWSTKDAYNKYSVAFGDHSHVEGQNNIALGSRSHAEGWMTAAQGWAAHSEGKDTYANAEEAHAEGLGSIASGIASHAEGTLTKATGDHSHAEGHSTQAIGEDSHAEGMATIAYGLRTHAEGCSSTAYGIKDSEGKPVYENEYDIDSGNFTIENVEKAWKARPADKKFSIAYSNWSHTEGQGTLTTGPRAHAEGWNTHASGNSAHAEGRSTTASGAYAHAEGHSTESSGTYAHAEGYSSKAKASTAHAEGYGTTAEGTYSHTEGYNTATTTAAPAAHVEGESTTATNKNAHAEGYSTTAAGEASHAEGYSTTASGKGAHAEGYNTNATSNYAHAEGNSTIACGAHAHAEGSSSTAYGVKDSDGNPVYENEYEVGSESFSSESVEKAWNKRGAGAKFNMAFGSYSHTEGQGTLATGSRAHAEGWNTHAAGDSTHAEGFGTVAHSAKVNDVLRRGQHVQGTFNIPDTNAEYLHIVGNGEIGKPSNAHTLDRSGNAWFAGNITLGAEKTGVMKKTDYVSAGRKAGTTVGTRSTAEGYSTTASGSYSHAEGCGTIAKGTHSHAEGYYTQAAAYSSHAEGYYTQAEGDYSHAEGWYTQAEGDYSHAEGHHTIATSDYQHVQGKYNVKDTTGTYAHIVGNGTKQSECSNAHTLDWNGNAWFAGEVKIGGTGQDDSTAKILATEEYADKCITGIEDHIVTYANPIEDSLLNVVSYIEPVQRGIGDPTPIGGKNHFYCAESKQIKKYGVSITTTAGNSSVNITGTATDSLQNGTDGRFSTITLPKGTYTISIDRDIPTSSSIEVTYTTGHGSASTSHVSLDKASKSWTVTVEADFCEMSFALRFFSKCSFDNLDISIQVEKGSIATSFEQHTVTQNIRALAGHNEVKVARSGKNLFSLADLQKVAFRSYLVDDRVDIAVADNGVVVTRNEANASSYGELFIWKPIQEVDSKTFTISAKLRNAVDTGTLSSFSPWIYAVYIKDGGLIHERLKTIDNHSDQKLAYTFTVDSTSSATAMSCDYIGFEFYLYAGDGSTIEFYDIQLEAGDTATDYEPYTGNTYTVQLNDTVYGGLFNWSTGELVSDMVCLTLTGDEDWKSIADGSDYNYAFLTIGENGYIDTNITQLCSHFKTATITSATTDIGIDVANSNPYNDARIRIRTKKGCTLAECVALLKEQYQSGTPVQVCFGVSKPVPVQLTSQEITALTGTNYLLSSTGTTLVKQNYVQADKTLTKKNFAADAKVVGDRMTRIDNLIEELAAQKAQVQIVVWEDTD